MITEQELLLNALCVMMPYKPMVNVDDELSIGDEGSDYTLLGVNANKRIVLLGLDFDDAYATHNEHLKNIKPYLRPMENMTEEELEIYNRGDMTYVEEERYISAERCLNIINFLNSHYLDYNGLIPKGLALPAPEGMYEILNLCTI